MFVFRSDRWDGLGHNEDGIDTSCCKGRKTVESEGRTKKF